MLLARRLASLSLVVFASTVHEPLSLAATPPVRSGPVVLDQELVARTRRVELRRPVITQALAADLDGLVEAILRQLTLEEKIGQLSLYSSGAPTGPASGDPDYREGIRTGRVGALLNVVDPARANELQALAMGGIGIPLRLDYDVIHGHRTMFPIPLAMAAAFDPGLVEIAMRVAGREAAAAGIHLVYAPMVDIARDPRWGRIAEGFGEDPVLGAAMAQAAVRGFSEYVQSTLKHYVAYGKAEAGRDYNSASLGPTELHEIYLPPFAAGVRAGADAVMVSFNTVDGIPMTMHEGLLRGVLRGELGFGGLIVTDWTGIPELVAHRVASDERGATLLAHRAGVDVDMQGDCYRRFLPELVGGGHASLEEIDASVRRVLRGKLAAGLFADPFVDAKAPVTLDRASAYRVAVRAPVLLKNDPVASSPPSSGERASGKPLLPLRWKDYAGRRLLVVGALAERAFAKDSIGSWEAQGRAEDVVTVLEAMTARGKAQGVDVRFVAGGPVAGPADEAAIEGAVRAASEADVIVAVLGETARMSGEAASRAQVTLPAAQRALLQALHARAKAPIALVLMTGRPLVLDWEAAHVPAILLAWQLGLEQGPVVADLLFGGESPSGKLPVTFPRHVGQIPIYYGTAPTGRPLLESDSSDANTEASPRFFKSGYIDTTNEPAFPFGYGLNYTTFALGRPRLSHQELSATGTLEVAVEVRNTGARKGREVVQLYLRDDERVPSPPVRELRGFRAIELAPGERATVRFSLTSSDLSFYSSKASHRLNEPGTHTLWVSTSSDVRGVPSVTFKSTALGAVKPR